MYFVYILRCIDDSLYTGITTELSRRVEEHNFSDKGAKYTRTRRPVTLVYFEKHGDRSSASKREYEIKKKMTRVMKLKLISTQA
ncbi:MAG TPA: GIY-YIG nuclease family protein [Sulfurovum sp.]|nr:GIY-YIG nuclease family protein [Sulfurovum sp.]